MDNTSYYPRPGYISVGVVAKNCGVSNTTVLRWISNGEIPAFRLPGGHYRISSSDFLDFMNKYHIPVVNETPVPPADSHLSSSE